MKKKRLKKISKSFARLGRSFLIFKARIVSCWPLLLIVGGAVFLRLWRLDQNPPSLNWDEVSHGYNAY